MRIGNRKYLEINNAVVFGDDRFFLFFQDVPGEKFQYISLQDFRVFAGNVLKFNRHTRCNFENNSLMQFERPCHFSNFQAVCSFSYSIAIHAGKWQNREKGDADMQFISDSEAGKRLKAWADVTMLSLELKRAAMRKRHPELRDDEINALVREELSMLKMKQDER
jgi:hypothetical protein